MFLPRQCIVYAVLALRLCHAQVLQLGRLILKKGLREAHIQLLKEKWLKTCSMFKPDMAAV